MLYLAHDTFLCNQMFPFANVIAFALKNDETVIYPSFAKHADDFPYFRRNRLCQFPVEARASSYWKFLAANRPARQLFLRANHRFRMFPHILMTPEQNYDFERESSKDFNEKMLAAKGAILDGLYFLSHNNFINAKATIKHVFAPSPRVINNVNACIGRARENADVLIGMHMRFGDYVTLKKTMAYSTNEYYEVMKKFNILFRGRRTTFLICSDKQQDLGSFPEVRAETAPGSTLEDLYCLSKCDLIVGPPSTFSQWASFYGDVPIFNINYKNEVMHGLEATKPGVSAFLVHHAGYGRHSVRRQDPLKEAIIP